MLRFDSEIPAGWSDDDDGLFETCDSFAGSSLTDAVRWGGELTRSGRSAASRAAARPSRNRRKPGHVSDVTLGRRFEAQRKLAERIEFKDALGMKISQEQTDLALPRSSRVEIVDRTAQRPRLISPNRVRASAFVGCGTGCSFLGLVLLRRRSAWEGCAPPPVTGSA